MKNLAELEDKTILEHFLDSAIQLTRQKARSATTEKEFGKNDDVADGQMDDNNVDA